MKPLSRLAMPFLIVLLTALLLVACGDATNTVAPASSNSTAAMTTSAAMTTGAAMTTSAAMTTGAAMAGTTEAAMAGVTTAAAMAGKTTEAAMTGTTAMAMTHDGPLTGAFNNQGAEAVAGKATVGKTADGKVVLRLEDLKSANGPDLHVYLTRDASPSTSDQIKNGVEIGKLKATQGNSNYDVDPLLDLSQYKSVAVYCKSVSVVFGYANLNEVVANK